MPIESITPSRIGSSALCTPLSRTIQKRSDERRDYFAANDVKQL